MSEKEELGKIEAKIEIISEAKQKALKIIEILKSDVVRMDGGVAGVKEASKTAADFAGATQRELQQLVQAGKISVDVSNFCLSFLNKLSSMIVEKAAEVDRAHYAKLGELRAVEMQAEDLSKVIAILSSSAKNLSHTIAVKEENARLEELRLKEIPPVPPPLPPLQEQSQVVVQKPEEHVQPVKDVKETVKKRGRKKVAKASPEVDVIKDEKIKKNAFDNVWENVLKMKKRG